MLNWSIHGESEIRQRVLARDELDVLHREGVGQPRRHRGNRDQAGAHECDTGSGVRAKGLLHGVSLIGSQCEVRQKLPKQTAECLSVSVDRDRPVRGVGTPQSGRWRIVAGQCARAFLIANITAWMNVSGRNY